MADIAFGIWQAGEPGFVPDSSDDALTSMHVALEAWLSNYQRPTRGGGMLQGERAPDASTGPDGLVAPGMHHDGAHGLTTAGLGYQLASGEGPACSMPLPASWQPVVETEGFRPFEPESPPQEPACSMPLPLERQRSDNGPLFIAGGYDRNFLALLGNASANGPTQVGRLAGGLSLAEFSAWHEALSPSAMAGGLEAIYPAQRGDAPGLMNPSFEIGERT